MQGWHTTFLGMRGLPRDISDFEMKAFFTFDGAERDAINARRGDGRKTGEKEMACLIKGRLLLINTITIDGERVYQRAQEEGQQAEADAQTDGADEFVDTTDAQMHPAEESEAMPAARVQSPTVTERRPGPATAPAPRQQPRDSFSRPRQGFREEAVAH